MKETVAPPPIFRHWGTLAACLPVILILSNIISMKLMNFFGWKLDVGLFIFPFSYIMGDVLAEVYGFQAARRAIWTGFLLLIFANLVLQAAVAAPPAPGWTSQEAFKQVFGMVPRISLASLIGYLFGELTNSWTLVRIRRRTGENKRYLRMIGSTLVGQAVDTTLFLVIAFGGVWPTEQLIVAWVTGYVFKVVFELPLLPLTYAVTAWFKKSEAAAFQEQRNYWFNIFRSTEVAP